MTSMKIPRLRRNASSLGCRRREGSWLSGRAALGLALLVALAVGIPSTAFGYACPQNPPPPKTEKYQGFLGRVYEQNGQQLPYRLFVPKDYDATKSYPLVLYLHHAGLAGTDSHNDTDWDNCVQLTSEIGSGGYGGVFVHQAVDKDGKRFDTQERYPHFVLAPHANSPAYGFGGGVQGSASGAEHPTRPLLMGILADVQAEFKIDPARLYVTGISMGCYGTWDLIMRKPGLFAAASPQSCRGDPDTKLLAALKDMPIWSMCGTNDSYFAGAQAMSNGMKQVGATDATFTFTAMEGVGHSINNRGYDYPGFIDWMFKQRLAGAPGSGGSAGAGGVGAGGASFGGTAGAAGATSGGVDGGFAAGSAGVSPVVSGGGSPALGGGGGGAGGGQAMAPNGGAGASGASTADETDSSGCSLVGSPLTSNALLGIGALTLASVLWRRSQRHAKRKTGMLQ